MGHSWRTGLALAASDLEIEEHKSWNAASCKPVLLRSQDGFILHARADLGDIRTMYPEWLERDPESQLRRSLAARGQYQGNWAYSDWTERIRRWRMEMRGLIFQLLPMQAAMKSAFY